MAGTVLDVEPQDFVTSSSSAALSSRALASAGAALRSGLAGSSRMAGSDPTGLKWAAQYDKVAADAVAGLDSLEHTFGQIAAGLSVTGLNYATADWLSSGRSGHAPGFTVPSLPAPACSAPPPSAAGGSRASDIPGWEYVANFIGDMWPDGDTATLRHAQSVWSAFADDLDTIHGSDVPRILSALEGTQTPELASIYSTVTTVKTGVSNLAQEARNLARAAGDLADQIDKVHRQTEQALQDLLDQIAATAVIGLGLTVFTAGLSDAAAGLAAGGEVAATVARIFTFIAELGTNVARVVDTVAESAGAVARVAGISEQITIRIVTIAGNSVVTGVGGAVTNVGVTEIVDPGANLADAAVDGFVGGAAFGVLSGVSGEVVRTVVTRSAVAELLGKYPSGALRNVKVLENVGRLVSDDGRAIPTEDLVHPQADLLDGSYATQVETSAGLRAADPLVQKLLPRGFVRWNGGDEASYSSRYVDGAYENGAPKIRGSAWPDPSKNPEGFASPTSRTPVVLQPGFKMDRFGDTRGAFTSPSGTEFPPRALHDYSLDAGYHQYEVVHELPAWAGPTAEAFGKPGGGPQIYSIVPIKRLLEDGFIKEVTP